MLSLLPLVRDCEPVLARTKKGLEKNQNEVAQTKKGLESAWRDFKATWYTELKLILFINTHRYWAIIFVLKELINRENGPMSSGTAHKSKQPGTV